MKYFKEKPTVLIILANLDGYYYAIRVKSALIFDIPFFH